MKIHALARFLPALAALSLSLLPTDCLGAPGDLYVADSAAYAIFKFTPAGDRSAFASNLYQPRALAFDRKGNLFLGESGAGIPPIASVIYKYTPDGTRTTFATLGLIDLLGMAFDGAGNLFVATAGKIFEVRAQRNAEHVCRELGRSLGSGLRQIGHSLRDG